MNIDLSKAPEGATHAGTMRATATQCWYKLCGNGHWMFSYGKSMSWGWVADKPAHIPLIPLAWNGEGLPPVGIEIEAMMRRNMHDGYAWHRAKVVHGPLPGSEGEVLVFCLETTSPAWVDEFRPVRTPEQIAEEEREAEIKAMAKIFITPTLGTESPYSGCRALYDAGYRRQVVS